MNEWMSEGEGEGQIVNAGMDECTVCSPPFLPLLERVLVDQSTHPFHPDVRLFPLAAASE